MNQKQIRAAVEAMLFACGEPIGSDKLAQAVQLPQTSVENALEELRTRIFNLEYQKYLDEIAGKRKTMVSTGDRSAKIRTYNYPQGRVTDHRINLTLYKLDKIMNGDIQEILDACIAADQAAKLAKMNEV